MQEACQSAMIGDMETGYLSYKTRMNRLNFVWPLLITALGAFVRWYRLDDVRLLWDHAYPIAQAQRLLSQSEWPTLGQVTTFFISNPPGQAYVDLIPLTLFGSMWGVFWFVTTLNVLAVPLLYRLGREMFDECEALIGSFVFAISPWVILYSRATWSSALTPIGTALILVLLLPAMSGSAKYARHRRVFAALISLTILAHSYLLALFIVPIQIGLILLLRFRHVPWRAAGAGGLVFATSLGLFVFNLIRDWPTQTARLAIFSQKAEEQTQFKAQAWRLAVRYAAGLDYRPPSLPEGAAPPILVTLAQVFGYVLVVALIVGVVLALRSCWRRDRQAWVNAALLIWWLTPIVLLSINRHEIHPWHLRLSIPAGHLLIARGLRPIWTGWRWSGRFLLLSSLCLAVVSLANFNLYSDYNAAHPASGELDHITLGTSRRVAQVLRRLADTYRVNEGYANIPPPDLTAWAQRPMATVSWFNDRLIILPLDRPAIYLRLGRGGPPPLFLLAKRAETLAFADNSFVAFDVFPSLDRAAVSRLPQIPVNWPSDTGRTFLGYTVDGPWRAGGTTTVLTYWLIEALPDNYTQFLYGPYAHLNTSEGIILVNADAPGIEGYYYRLNDIYIQPISLPIPADAQAGEYQLELGLYDGVHQAGTTFFPPGGVPQPFYTVTVNVEPEILDGISGSVFTPLLSVRSYSLRCSCARPVSRKISSSALDRAAPVCGRRGPGGAGAGRCAARCARPRGRPRPPGPAPRPRDFLSHVFRGQSCSR